ncbi:MAG: phenylacetate--CoA ligase [Sedimentisphaerales bacterium]|jgi:phenylacetate-CoA ligase|nr:phenylacetate--CoA ligase [Sedimentisphaerales bacterium]HNY79529.1 phenylacetate--CoA ligase [Sedimentisphaerales bacterium]HOC62339.1 phenylacetate--CoA ligase [Sedimentisphaerales bacterium]HOH65511.1 phenylacetate--CoA ligase [Sedimentisphaerales bacterium]HQA89816.1 phenylacetate--CoA ligase [Sedimentisphaerales bacterium]
MDIPFWSKEIETLDRASLETVQLERLRDMVSWALKTPFYNKKLSSVGIRSPEDIRGFRDLERIPFTTKDDLRRSFPKGLLAVEMTEVVRIHSSSGTTGIPTVIYYTRDDVDRWTDLLARSIVATGASAQDIFQNMMSYGLFTGGLGLHYGAERVGMAVIPIGGGNTKRQIQTMKDFQTTILHVTPSYLLHIHSQFEAEGVKAGDLALRRAFIGAEPHSENTRRKIDDLLHIQAFNSYGLSELNGPGVAFECVCRKDMHLWEDAYIVEIIDPTTGRNVEDGQEGEVVLTNLIRRAMPILRYRTRDLAFLHPEPCECGRTHRRLSRILGRTDDMLIINGVNVFPSQIEEKIMKVPEVATNYQIHVDKKGALDRLTVKVEIYPKLFLGDVAKLEALRARIREELRSSIVISPNVELHEPGSLPVSEGKAKRVVDERPKD